MSQPAPVSRRDLLRGGGRLGLGLTAAWLLAACGADDAPSQGGSSATGFPPETGEIKVAQWPLYIDRARGGHRPTLEAFTEATGIQADYREIINDNQEFFAKLYPQFNAGQPTGWDLIAPSDWVVTRLVHAGWLETLDRSLLPTVEANMLPAFRDPAYDPGNAHSTPWQGGVTGIAYDPTRTGRRLSSMADLWDEAFAGHVGMMTEMVDTMSLTLLMLGVEPQQATLEDAQRAGEKLIEQRDKGIVRGYYGQDYIDSLKSGDTWASMAWSGDVFYTKYLGGSPNLEFYVPEEGGMLWTGPTEIPVMAQNPRGAHAFMDFYFQPEIAAQVTDWVLYMTPVRGVQKIMAEKGASAKDDATKEYYETLSTSPLLFPPEDLASERLHLYKPYSEEELEAYNDIFTGVIES